MTARLAAAVAAIAVLATAAAVPGCDESRPVAREQSHEDRLQRGAVVVGRYATEAGELVRLSIPSVALRGNPAGDQTCFVWRDPEYRTSTLHCPYWDSVAD